MESRIFLFILKVNRTFYFVSVFMCCASGKNRNPAYSLQRALDPRSCDGPKPRRIQCEHSLERNSISYQRETQIECRRIRFKFGVKPHMAQYPCVRNRDRPPARSNLQSSSFNQPYMQTKYRKTQSSSRVRP